MVVTGKKIAYFEQNINVLKGNIFYGNDEF